MEKWFRCGKSILLLCLLIFVLGAGGCEGTDTRENVDDAVEEMAGKKDLERYKQMKDDLGKIQNQQEDRYRQLNQEQSKQ
jgi:hypothetical protein